MSDPHQGGGEQVPLMQRLFDNPFLLMVGGLAIMFIIFTAWGMIEILSLPQSTLP